MASPFTLHHADCLEVLRTMPDASVHAMVTDPPYGLSFMGRKWDYDVPSVDIWRECLRVLKPGGHLLAFAGTRTQHRMAVNIEDAGFEIRDMIAWVYGSGFPKSMDISKAIDKAAGAEREAVGVAKGAGSSNTNSLGVYQQEYAVTAPATPEAQQWAGWGTALKPSLEPVTVARKPIAGTVAANVLQHGCGGLNIDGCRVGTDGGTTRSEQAPYAESGWRTGHKIETLNAGRWPANLIHSGDDEVVRLFPQQQSGANPTNRGGLGYHGAAGQPDCFAPRSAEAGSAARFFYTAKASASERQGTTHPTVKPLDLMRYLVRLVTPPGGIVLDPFMGSGTTIKAAISEGFQAIGIEREADYFAMAEQRLNGAQIGLPLEVGS